MKKHISQLFCQLFCQFFFQFAGKFIAFPLSVFIAFIMSSCSDDSYSDAVPARSKAIIRTEFTSGDENAARIVKTVFHAQPSDDCGIDFGEPAYFFVSPDGDFGLCMKVSDDDDLTEWLSSIRSKVKITSPEAFRDCHFSMIDGSWMVGYSKQSLLVLGPVAPGTEADVRQKLSKWFKQDEDDGIRANPMYDRLDSIKSSTAMVAQADALPQQLVMPFMFGTPKGTDASKVIIEACVGKKNGVISFSGKTTSFIPRIKDALRKSEAIYRPVKGRYVASMPDDAVAGFFVNVKGNDFLPVMQANSGAQMLLAGVNTAIDMDNIIRSIDGDMAIVMTSLSEKTSSMMMSAELSDSKWLSDVGYWKQSCPAGARIADWKKNAFVFTNDNTTYCFGVSDDKQYFSGSSKQMAEASVRPAEKPLPKNVQDLIRGQRFVLVLNMHGNNGSVVKAMTSVLTPMFGKFSTIVFSL